MRKEENQKINSSLKNEGVNRSRSLSPKAYLGCDTCRLKKKINSNNKSSDYETVQNKFKLKKTPLEKCDRELATEKIKLTDLCDEDKNRIVELIEELSKLSQKNQLLKAKFDEMEKEKQDQQEYIFKQANLFLEEKNFYSNEINEYRIKIEKLENEMKNRISQWEKYGKSKNNEIEYLTKALQKSLKEKNELHEQMTHLNICLKHSLESFQRLKAEVTELQHQEQRIRKFKSAACQTENNENAWEEKNKLSDGDSEEEEYLSTCNQDSINGKNSLDIINDKLEYVYQLLKKKKKNSSNSPTQKYDIDLSILLRNENLSKEKRTTDVRCGNKDNTVKEYSEENDKLLKPFEQCSTTLVQAEKILKTFGQPTNSVFNECAPPLEKNNVHAYCTDPKRNIVRCSSFLQNNIVQKNNLFKSTEDYQCDEDRLLEELFYSDQSLNLGSNSILKLDAKDEKKNCVNRPFTW